jgi:cell division protein FtsI (penicillin-binding protein 3)
MSLKRDIVWRVAIIYIGVLLFSIAIVGKILYLQFVKGNELAAKAETLTLKEFIIQPNRGDIYASDNRLLASSIPYYEIRMDLNSNAMSAELFNRNIDSLAYCLSRLFKDKSSYAYKQELMTARRNGERYHLIQRGVNYTKLKELKTFPIFREGRYKGGFIYVQDNQRILPHSNLASRTIGYLTKGSSGNVVGIEGAYDHELSGRVGVRLMQKLSGNVWMPVTDKNEVEPRDGNDIITTIDINLQDVAENALLSQLIKHDAHHGSVILMEVKTGEVKAIVNLEKGRDGKYRENYNYAIGESTEPGSTFKLASLLVALEDGVVQLEDTIDAGNGVVRFYDKDIHDTKWGGYGKITVKEAFEVSSNVGVSKLIYENYHNRPTDFVDRLYAMRLNEKLGVEIKGEGLPQIKYPGDPYWSGISLPMMSHGYELRMTPLQILAFYNAIANNGKMVKPRFVKEIRYHGNVLKRFETEVLNPSICSKETVKKAIKMLEGVVENGTAKNLNNSNYSIAGKTGTAQIANEKYGYTVDSKVSYQASFVGFFPSDNPMYSCMVVVNSPSNAVYYGNLVAGPVFKEIADKVYATKIYLQRDQISGNQDEFDYPYSKHGSKKDLALVLSSLGIQVEGGDEESDWVATHKHDTHVEIQNIEINRNLVPNVVEMGLQDAIYLLEELGLKVVVNGRGKVIKQSLVPGAVIHPGQVIQLDMSFS